MQKTIELKVKEPFIQDFQKGVPLVSREAITNESALKEEGAIIDLFDSSHNFLGRGYYGRQNKGIGWVLTNKQDEAIDFSFFQRKILKAINKRQGFYQDEETTAFRLFNGEGDGIGGLTIDYFDGYYQINWYSDGIYTFKEQVIQVLDNLGDYKAIYEKKRFDTKGKYMEDDDFVKGERGEFPIIIKENGMRYAVYLNDGAMVGIFLDQREVRKAIRDKYAKGKHVLNTFSYTGAFSIAAALGGADKTTSVDLAKRSKAKTIEQFSVNDIDFEQHDIRVMDVFDYFQYAQRHQLKFDMVVLDPPSFARSKKRTFSTSKDYPKLLMDTISITEKNGVIVASTNNASFGMKKFKGFVEKAFKQMNTGYKILEEYHLPADFQVDRKFQQGNYLKVLFIQVK
ncbi:ribosomal RNA large subunit methyltransferase I [Oceanobacillus picturae]|uniref:Ribosomal RNA large subunit methyltransferase I n=1 Tax=Oceanobacillus picturae TaxID=171693 RepID=W9ALZ7_9BACI|nr:class I SAM-dependent rRNA methyltransferase [Oceanobacillus picturae]GAQ16507.1 ribosomal RNA large subunit methyltransferase I [Oceanobacillus picturae]CDO03932.1 Ribosomal RNA large subunit methyltransferase I [Oceanobacillus picturae]